MSLKNFRDKYHPELEISLYLSNLSMKISHLTDLQTIHTFLEKCKNIPGMSPKIFRNISHPELEISSYLSNFSKEVSQLRDFQT